MMAMFIANPAPKAKPRRGGSGGKKGRGRKRMARAKARKNAWRGQKKAHKIASLIGHAYRPGRKTGPKSPARYLQSRGVSKRDLRKYTKKRKSAGQGRRVMGVRVNQEIPGSVYFNRGRKKARKNRRGYSRGRKVSSRMRRDRSGRFVGKKGSKRRNPRYNPRGPSGRFVGKKRGGSRHNPVLPYMAWENPVLPYAAFNPAATAGPLDAIMEAGETALSLEFWKDYVLPFGAGFIGAQFAGGFVQAFSEKVFGRQEGAVGSMQRVGSRLLGSVAVTSVSLLVTKDVDLSTRVLAGGLLSALVQIIEEMFGKETYDKMVGMGETIGGLSADLTEELKDRIASSVRSAVHEGGSSPYSPGQSAFVSTQNLQTAPDLGPGPRISGTGDFVQTQGLRTAPIEGGPSASEVPVVSDLDAFSNESADMMLV